MNDLPIYGKDRFKRFQIEDLLARKLEEMSASERKDFEELISLLNAEDIDNTTEEKEKHN